jgi:subtilisin family serine protease
VVLRGPDDPEAVGNETAGLYRGRLSHIYRQALRGFAIQLPEPAARALASDPRVDYVEEDGLVTASVVQSGATWGLDRIDQRPRTLDTQYQYTRDGTGVNVYVIDTGIRVTHTEFGGRAFNAADHVDDDHDGDPYDVGNDDANPSVPDGDDCNGHGTHVAGTIGGEIYGVAKNVTLWSHRVLDCQGNGTLSALIAGVDDVTVNARQPAVANLSLGGPVSSALDAAVRGSIASGVTYVIAAGNSNVDASTTSPARVAEAITVGATSSTDVRASFSNFGASLDLFAPGVSIRSAGLASNIATVVMSGTSMAAPHVAGIAALYLEAQGPVAPAAVRNALVAAGTLGVVGSAGYGSPNVLAYSLVTPATPPSVTVLTPNGGEKLFTGAPFVLEWTATDADGVASIDVELSTNNGSTYTGIPGCVGLAGTATSCTWSAPGPVSTTARIRVLARDVLGALGGDASNATFTIASGMPFVTVSVPNTVVNWGRGSTQQIKWTHNLGATSFVRVDVSRDAGATYAPIATSVKNTSATSGLLDWTVTGPNTTAALIRVSWLRGPAVDASNVAFTIADPYLTLTAPTGTANWGYSTMQRPSWTTNLGPGDRVDVLLSIDGGLSFPTALATGIAASAKLATIQTPSLGTPTTTARVQVVWTNPPAGFALSRTSPANFRIEPPFVRVTAPNGGQIWTSGYTASITWAQNLGLLETVQIDLSTDGGQTYPVVIVASTGSDGTHSAVVSSAWITPTAKVRVTWLKGATVTDASDAVFKIQ